MSKVIDLETPNGSVISYSASLYRKNKKSLNSSGFYKVGEKPDFVPEIVPIRQGNSQVVKYPISQWQKEITIDGKKMKNSEYLESLGWDVVSIEEVAGSGDEVEEVKDDASNGKETEDKND